MNDKDTTDAFGDTRGERLVAQEPDVRPAHDLDLPTADTQFVNRGERELLTDEQPEDAGSLALDETIASGVREHTDEGVDPSLRKQVLAGLFSHHRKERPKIDRFPILAKLGAGGMGVVYSGYDEDLDRKIAIKLVRSGGFEGQGREAKRLLREARALAKLVHPNVVQVFQAGPSEDGTFIAMEFVRGQTLAAWLAEGPRPWREVVAVFVQAGRGLAAAHAAGLIHRDFKPANAMIDEHGVVKVLDFGLARTPGSEAEVREEFTSEGASLDERLTRTGSIMGTPGYMAPEQLEAGEVDARSDQFSFCVALYEALYDQRPFPTDSLGELIQALLDGAIKPPPRDRAVPPWVRESVLRGLAREPDERHPSMNALLDALERDPIAKRRRTLALGSAFVAIGLAGVGVAPLINPTPSSPASPPSCGDAAVEIDEVWSPARREAIGDALAGSGAPYAGEVWDLVVPQLDAYVGDWADMRREACETHLAAAESDALFDQRNACLDRRLAGLQTLLVSLEQGQAEMVEMLPLAVAGLPPIDACGDTEALMADVRPPEDPAVAAEVARLREQVARAQSLEGLGQYDAGLELIEAVVERAEALGYAPLEAEALLQRGYLQQLRGTTEDTLASLTGAELRAIAGDHPEVAAAALSRSMLVRGVRAREPERALEDAPRVEALLERVPHAQGLRGVFLNDLADLWRQQGEFERAIDGFEASLAVKRAAFGERHLQVAFTLANASVAHAVLGDYPRANALLDESIAIRIEALGPRHPVTLRAMGRRVEFSLDLGCVGEARPLIEPALALLDGTDAMSSELALSSLSAAAKLEFKLRNYARAREYVERGLAIAEALDSPIDEALQLRRLAEVEFAGGAVERGLELHERALALASEAVGEDSPFFAYSLRVYGNALSVAGDVERALAQLERALASFEALGAEPEVRTALVSLGRAQARAGQLEQAQRSFERAIAMRTRKGEAQLDIERARIEVELARVLLERGRPAEAKITFEGALATLDGHCRDETIELALIRFDLARTLVELDVPERETAAQLAEQSAAALAELGPAFAPELEQIERWRRGQEG